MEWEIPFHGSIHHGLINSIEITNLELITNNKIPFHKIRKDK